MQTPVAFLNLAHGKWRTLVSVSGVALAIILVFMQLGFLGAVGTAATQIYDHLEFDVLLRSPDYFHFCDAREIPRSYLYQVASMPEVDSVRPFHVTLGTWRIPPTVQTSERRTVGELRGIVVMAVEPAENVFDVQEISRKTSDLVSPEFLLIDRKTKGDDYGAKNGELFGDEDNDREVEVWDKRFRIVGNYELGAGLAANGSVLMSRAGYARFYPGDTLHNVNFGLVRLKPGVDPEDFCARLAAQPTYGRQVPHRATGTRAPVTVMTRKEVRWYEQKRWLLGTPIGAIFIMGVVVALVVGSVVVYMVLSNDVANHLREYATLKAMGYTHRFLSGVVMQQAMVMALLGYAISLLIAHFLYWYVGNLSNLPMQMNWLIRGLVFVLSIGMCCVSGLATLRKLRKAEPADLF